MARGHDEVLPLILSHFLSLARFGVGIIDVLQADQSVGFAGVLINMSFVGEPCFFKFDPRACGGMSPDVIDFAGDLADAGLQVINRNRNCESGSPVRI